MCYKSIFNFIIIILLFVIFGILYSRSQSKLQHKMNNLEYFYGPGGGGPGPGPGGMHGGGPGGPGGMHGGGPGGPGGMHGGGPGPGGMHGGGPGGMRGGPLGERNWSPGRGLGLGWTGIDRGNYWNTELVGDWNRPVNNYIYYNNDDKCSQLDSPFREQCNDCEDNSCNYNYDNSSNTGKCSC